MPRIYVMMSQNDLIDQVELSDDNGGDQDNNAPAAEAEAAEVAQPAPCPAPAVPPVQAAMPAVPDDYEYQIGGTIAVAALPTLPQFEFDPLGGSYYRDLKMCNVTLPGLSSKNESLEGKEKDWFQGYFWPDGHDQDSGSRYWITLPTMIEERFGLDIWTQLVAVGQDRINRAHLHTWDGMMFIPEDYGCYFGDCITLGNFTTELPQECYDACTAAQNKHDTPSQSKGQYSVGHLPHDLALAHALLRRQSSEMLDSL
jgi:hypothetical protein